MKMRESLWVKIKKLFEEKKQYTSIVMGGFGFTDPSTGFGEGLILLYHRVDSVLCMVLSLVVYILGVFIVVNGQFTTESWSRIYTFFVSFFGKGKKAFGKVFLGTISNIVYKFDAYMQSVSNYFLKMVEAIKAFIEYITIQNTSEYKNMEYSLGSVPFGTLQGMVLSCMALVTVVETEDNAQEFGLSCLGEQWDWSLCYSLTVFVPVISHWDLIPSVWGNGFEFDEFVPSQVDLRYGWNLKDSCIIFEKVVGWEGKLFTESSPEYEDHLNEIYDIFVPLWLDNASGEKIHEALMRLTDDRRTTFYPITFDYDYTVRVLLEDGELSFGEPRLDITGEEMVLPFDVTNNVGVSSKDVVHSLFVPEGSSKADAMPGRSNLMVLNFKRPGKQVARCAELCGPNHGYMPMVIKSIPYQNFMAHHGLVSAQVMNKAIDAVYESIESWVLNPNVVTRAHLKSSIMLFINLNNINADAVSEYYQLPVRRMKIVDDEVVVIS